MTLTLNLPSELEQRLREEAQRQGLGADQLMLRLLDEHLPPGNERPGLVALLQSWIDEDEDAEQRETGEYLIHVLDEDRTSDRKLFPPELQGTSW